ncbi:MAG: glycosyltransferase family 2 protein [Ruminiclostridium sp.]
MLSIIIPAFNEEENIENTAEVISSLMEENGIDCEIIFVDDGSKDRTWELIDGLTRTNPSVRGLKFSRNFGKEGAIFAGLKACLGDCAVVIDCDLQHPPKVMLEMYNLWKQGYEVVEAVKADRGKEGLLYKLFAKSFYRMMKNSANINLDRASDYKLMDRKVIDALNEMPERLTFFRALSSWVGFKTTQVEFVVAPRNAGKTKWNFKKLFKFALNNITSFTTLPMQIITVTGIICIIGAIILAVQTLVNFFCGNAADGFTTVILLQLIIGSVLMIGLGIIGYYISKIYEEIKFRPRYIVSIDTNERRKNNADNSGSR